jgi:hypothetical protein
MSEIDWTFPEPTDVVEVAVLTGELHSRRVSRPCASRKSTSLQCTSHKSGSSLTTRATVKLKGSIWHVEWIEELIFVSPRPHT